MYMEEEIIKSSSCRWPIWTDFAPWTAISPLGVGRAHAKDICPLDVALLLSSRESLECVRVHTTTVSYPTRSLKLGLRSRVGEDEVEI